MPRGRNSLLPGGWLAPTAGPALTGLDAEVPLDRGQPPDDRVEPVHDLVKLHRWAHHPHGPGLGPGLAGSGRGELDDLVPHPAQIPAQAGEHLGRHALALPDQAEQDVLGPDVVVAELQRLPQRELKDLLGPRGERDVARRRLAAPADERHDLLPRLVLADLQLPQRPRGRALRFPHQAEQEMLGADVAVVEVPGFFLRVDDGPPRPLGEPLEHIVRSPRGGAVTVHAGPAGPGSARPAWTVAPGGAGAPGRAGPPGGVTSRGRRSAARLA